MAARPWLASELHETGLTEAEIVPRLGEALGAAPTGAVEEDAIRLDDELDDGLRARWRVGALAFGELEGYVAYRGYGQGGEIVE